MLYFDTALVVKLYHDEPGRDTIRRFLREQNETVAGSALLRPEFAAATHRKLREKKLDEPEDVIRFLDTFNKRLQQGLIHLLPITSAVLKHVDKVYATLPGDVYLRASDAVHLATAAMEGFSAVHSNDRHLLAAAPYFHLRPVNPIAG